MRWSGQELTVEEPSALPGLARLNNLVRSVRTPDFAGITFHEVLAKSALNKIPGGGGPMPFGWTINPYRGCSHACVYCFARPTHTYLDLDSGKDFDNEIIVKVNVAEVLRKELAKPSWGHHPVALGTNTDPYQRAEGRYALMPGIIDALADSGTPFSILTKGTLLRRDLDLLAEASQRVPGRPRDVDRGLRRRTAAVGRAGHADHQGAPGDGHGRARARARLRRLPDADPPVPHRYPGAPRRGAAPGEGGRAPRRCSTPRCT